MADLSKPKVETTNFRRDLGKELALLSYSLWAIFAVAVVFSIFLYIFMVIPPPKKARLEDQGNLFSVEEQEKIERMAKSISSEKDINVFIYTEASRGNFSSVTDAEIQVKVDRKYREMADIIFLKDNSGIMVYIDEQERYFYIFTYGTAHASVTDSECDRIFRSVKNTLSAGNYGQATIKSLESIEEHSFTSGLLTITYVAMFVLPPVLALLLVMWLVRKRKTKSATNSKTYLDQNNSQVYQNSDTYTRQMVDVRYVSSSSGGSGFSGGGGGFSGGGGGGGRTGGGGGRF